MLLSGRALGQSFTFVPDDTVLSAPLGSEMVFNATLTNTSTQMLTLALIRTVNNLPVGWESSMCFSVCFQSTIDSIATTPAFGSSPLNPSESRPFSLHVYSTTNNGTGIVRIVAKNLNNPLDERVLTFTASSIPVNVSGVEHLPTEFSLSQNYPNSFNPSTTIGYSLPGEAFVTVKVYDVLGQEVKTLRNTMETTGNHYVVWDGRNTAGASVASGVYMYRMEAMPVRGTGAFSSVKKMLLLR